MNGMEQDVEQYMRAVRFLSDTSGGWTRKDAYHGVQTLRADQLSGKSLNEVKQLVAELATAPIG